MMPKADNVWFTHKEAAEALVKAADLHEGLWGIIVNFGIGGTNVQKEADGDIVPAAIVPILKVGLQRFEEENNLTVDAEKVNPK